jgi:hypothetical protein
MITLLPHSARAAYIMRVGVCRIGVPLGAIALLVTLVDGYRTTFESLRTSDGWLRLLGAAVLCIVEWVLGAGWLIGAALWHDGDGERRDRRTKP